MASDTVVKLIILGNGSVGKTAIIGRFVDDGFQKVYRQTVGLDFYQKKLELRRGKTVILQVWDIGGQSISSKMLGQYIWGSDIVMLAYDVTDPASFRDMEDWLTLTRRPFASTATDIPGVKKKEPLVYLLGNKIDLAHMRRVTPAMHDRFVEENSLTGGFFMSAQNGDQVLSTFYKAAAAVSGIELSAYELAFTERVLTATVHRGGEGPEAKSEAVLAMEREDAEMERRKAEGGKGCGCALM